MKKLTRSRGGASKGAALIIVLAVAPALGLAYLPRTTTNRQLAQSSLNDTTGRNVSMKIHQGKGTAHNAQRPMTTSACKVIASAVIVTAGSLYKVGDVLDPLFGNVCSPENYGFRLQVASVAPPGPSCLNGGCVTTVTIVPGIGYSATPSNPVRFGGSPIGTGFTANCTFN
jgi:hypothetical protein